MSLLPQTTQANLDTAYFLKANAQLINVSTLNAGTISTNSLSASTISTTQLFADVGTVSSFSTFQIDLDGQLLTAAPNELLLNGVPIATISSLSTIADWSLDPAISTVQMDGNDLNAAGTISSINIRSGNGFFQNLMAVNAMFISTQTSTISSVVNSADLGLFSTVSTGLTQCAALNAQYYVASQEGDFNTIRVPGNVGLLLLDNGGPQFGASAEIRMDWFQQGPTQTSMFYDTTISSVRLMTHTASGYTDNPASRLYVPETKTSSLYVSSINGSEFTSTGITVQVAGVSSLVANSISSLGAEIRAALFSTVQFNPSFNLDLNFDAGSLVGALKSGLTQIAVGVGAGLALVGSGIIAAAVSRRGNTNINTTVYEQYATTTQFQFSTLGELTSTFFRTVSSSGLANTVPGTELIISTIIPANTLCVRSIGDPINLIDPSTVFSSIQAFGQWTEVPAELVNVSSFADIFVSGNANVSSVTGLSSINGVPIADYQNISSISSLNEWALYPALSSIHFASGTPAIIQSATPATDNLGILGSNIQLVANYTDAKTLLLVSSISTATILGAADNLFGIGLPGLKIDAPNLFLSSAQVVAPGLFNGSTIAANLYTGREATLSSATLSSLTLSQSGAYGLSSVMFVSTSALPGIGTSSCLVTNTDFSVGQNDIYAQQIRLGYLNPSSQPSEIIFHSPNNTQRAFNLGNSDQTIRIQSTTNATTAGYLLDTQVNPPFFSTINQSTSMMAWFPSTTSGTIGISTIGFIPPKIVAGSFTSLSTQALAINTPLALWMERTDYSVGGITTSTNAIVIPSQGVFELIPSIQFEHPLGAATADFWLRKNGVDIPNTASEIYMPTGGQGQTLGVTSYIVSCAANDKLQVMVASPDTGVTAAFHQSTIAPYTKPANPSVILSVKCLNY